MRSWDGGPGDPSRARSAASWLAEFGIDANCDLVLVSAGSRKILVINAVRILTRMRPREAQDLVDKAPGLVMHQVMSERADKAKELLESLGATSPSAAIRARHNACPLDGDSCF